MTESDREFFARELNSFVPDRIFDAHAHLYRSAFFAGEPPALVRMFPELGWDRYQSMMGQLMPGREVSGLFFGFPSTGVDTAAANRFVAAEAGKDPGSRAQMLITPAMDPEFIRQTVREFGFVGLKCYHVWASTRPSFDAEIPTYLPEQQVRIAHQEELSITLHMVRARAMADPSNQQVIHAWARKYPGVRFILAHAARGFNPNHTIEGIGALGGLPNVWCDTSAVTEAGAVEAIARTLGVGRLLWGSDAPVSHDRGRCVAIGDSFLWLSEANTDFHVPYAPYPPVLVGLESLRALKQACRNLALGDTDIERIFHRNAVEMYGLSA